MTRNFHDPKDYEWKDDGNMIVCTDISGKTLFAVFNEGLRAVALNAYHAGLNHGKPIGREELRHGLSSLLKDPNP